MRTFGLFSSVLPAKLGIEVDLVDITDLDAVRAAVRPTTRLIHTEVIANPDLRVSDIGALAQIAHDNDALLTVDSTFTPPPLMRPLATRSPFRCGCNGTARTPSRSPTSWPATHASPMSLTRVWRVTPTPPLPRPSSPAATAASSPSPSPVHTRNDSGS